MPTTARAMPGPSATQLVVSRKPARAGMTMAHQTQSRPDSGLGLQKKTLKVVLFSLRGGYRMPTVARAMPSPSAMQLVVSRNPASAGMTTSEYATYNTVKAKIWPWPSGKASKTF